MADPKPWQTREFWEKHHTLSGEKLAEVLGTDGGSARRLIRKAKKNPRFKDIFRAVDNDSPVANHPTTLTDLGLIAPPTDGPAVLFYDIETAPALAWVWGAYDQNVVGMLEQDWYMLSFAYKWMNKEGLDFVSVYQDPAFVAGDSNDKFVAERLAALFDAADVLVAHNGDKFDRRKANQRFLFWGINPPSPYQTVDTLKIARREFAHFSNSLKDLCRIYGTEGKLESGGFDLWRGCMAGKDAAWKQMEEYNCQDVLALEDLYFKLLPWASHPGKPLAAPNHGFWSPGEMVCPRCGHTELTKRGTYRTAVSEFDTYQCDSCKSYSRFRTRRPQTAETALRLV